jgi:predicted glycoside hydrolase/deacetylase ChbG (UPF0249 family)
LLDEIPHPGPTAFRITGKEITIEQRQPLIVLIEDLPDADIRVLDCQYNRFVDLFGREPTHIDSHHHVHMIPAIFPIVAEFARRKGVAMRVDRQEAVFKEAMPELPPTTDGFSSAFYGEAITETLFLQVLDRSVQQGERSLEVMAHPAFIDNMIRKSAYCWPRLDELDVLTSTSLKYAIAERGYRLGTFKDL